MRESEPVIWVLEGLKAGDNAQARELAARLGGRIETRKLRYIQRWRKVPNFLLGESLVTLDRRISDRLAAPWPDLVIGVGRRSVPVARWIRRQSSGHTRLVQIGRPRARINLFDLILTTTQYGMPSAPNIIELALPIAPRVKVAEVDEWRSQLATLPEPKIAVLVGGPMKRLAMGSTEIARLADAAGALAQEHGGSLVVIGSPRTPAGLVESMAGMLDVPYRIFPWKAGKPNPYRAALQIAARFIVTADSVSMLAEALDTGKPVDVFRLPYRKPYRLPLSRWPFRWLVRAGFLATKRNVDV
ncbi:MAG TPA: ELM1/GtrOC1 family putative glycosyltransferase, partial [Aestuariivirga sp.]|nr:ELM1/GtrOC1 family putative glycosyltransferase [Aestuariivirga sp.]